MNEQEFKNILTEHNGTMKQALDRLIEMLTPLYHDSNKARIPDFDDVTIGPQPFKISYKNYKHVFMQPYANFTATLGSFGTFNFIAGNWYNIGYRAGDLITNTGAPVTVQIKYTDEVIP